MGSPITFSGFNSIDFTMILNAVMTQQRAPYNRLEAQKNTLESQNTAYGTLAGKLSSFQANVDALKAVDSLSFLSATSSAGGVGVTTTGGTVAGTYEMVVHELARPQVTATSTSYGALTDVVATGGSLTLTPANGDPPFVVPLSGSTTLNGLVDTINAQTTSPASASIVQTSPGVFNLVLTGRRTGTTGAFTISNALLGGMPPALADTNLDGISGDSATDNTQNASNAAFTVNGLSVTSASNAVADVVSGVTLSLLQKDPSTTVTVRVERDTSKAKDVLKKFINSYNDIMSFVKDLVTSLTSALRALDAQRCGLDVAGQNIANVNTPGYSRRTVDLATRGPDVIGAAGGGVNVIGIRSMRDQLLELRLQEEVSAQRQQQTVAGFLSVVEATLGAPGSSIDRSLDSFSMRSAGSLKRRYRQRRDKAYSCRPTAWRERSEAWLDALSRRVRMSTVKSAASSRTSIASPNGSRR